MVRVCANHKALSHGKPVPTCPPSPRTQIPATAGTAVGQSVAELEPQTKWPSRMWPPISHCLLTGIPPAPSQLAKAAFLARAHMQLTKWLGEIGRHRRMKASLQNEADWINQLASTAAFSWFGGFSYCWLFSFFFLKWVFLSVQFNLVPFNSIHPAPVSRHMHWLEHGYGPSLWELDWRSLLCWAGERRLVQDVRRGTSSLPA